MTVHASKGLEFPVVFVVNLARGTVAWRDPIRVAADPAVDSVSVSVGDFLSEADDDRTPREREETKRLLYVALTRARDRLYLASVVRDGRVQPGRGSLAEVMPASLLAALVSPGEAGLVTWTASSGLAHQLRRCTGSDEPTATSMAVPAEAPPVDRAVLSPGDPITTAVGPTRESASGSALYTWPLSDRLRGLAVHRLVQRRGFVPLPADASDVAREVFAVIRPDEAADLEDRETFVTDVEGAYSALCGRADIAAVYRQGDAFHEVPFSLQDGATTVRGTIDCLVRGADQRVTVLEFKTGRPRPEHEAQIALYCLATRKMFPDCTVDSQLIYP
jgi:ATP-dependent helicase/nuclease subunit A